MGMESLEYESADSVTNNYFNLFLMLYSNFYLFVMLSDHTWCVYVFAAHPSCLDLTDKMVQVVTTYPWQCMECKTCVECMDPYDEVTLSSSVCVCVCVCVCVSDCKSACQGFPTRMVYLYYISC